RRGRLQLLHARHAGTAGGIRLPARPGGRLRLPDGPPAGGVRPAPRLPAAGPGGPGADPRHGPRRRDAPGLAARRRVAGGPGLLLLRPPGPVPPPRDSRPVPGSPAADRLVLPPPPPRWPRQGEAPGRGLAALALAAAPGQARPAGGVLQAPGAAAVDDGRA